MRISSLTLLTCFFLLASFNLYAQQPKLKVAGADSASVSLTELKTEVKVIGNYAVTTMEMEFCNSSNRVLEGELTFPMPEGVSVSRYAIDINGKMREAVPVEKEKGQVAFENIIRRRVDPGLLEKVDGNNFRTRIYPLPAGGCRHVLVGYQQLLTLNSKYAFVYSLPLHFKEPIKQFDFAITVASNYIPEVGSDCNTGLKFEELNKVFTSTVSKQNFTPDGDFTITVPKTPDAAEISMQSVNGQYYFLINAFPNVKKVEKKIPDLITVVWDASLSGQNRDHKKEFELLDAYIKKKGNLTIQLFTIGLDLKKINNFSITGGNWSDLRKTLEEITYDGASNLGKLSSLPPASEYLFFSDGLSNWGNTDNMPLPKMPVYTICATNTADHSFLKYVASSTGGAFINLNELDIATAQQYLTEQTLQFLGIKPNTAISNVYPSMPTPVVNGCSIAGISSVRNTGVFLQYGYGNTVSVEQYLDMDANFHNTQFINIEKIWAQKKIAELDIQYEKNKEEISALSKKYAVITRNTSLIVLDAVQDYVQYDIEPPAELMGEYTRLMAAKKSVAGKTERDELAEARIYFSDVCDWWNTGFKPGTQVKDDADRLRRAKASARQQTSATSDTVTFNMELRRSNASTTSTAPAANAGSESSNHNTNAPVSPPPPPPPPRPARPNGSPVPDTDGDGVNDDEDKCINERGPASNFGCPVVSEEIIKRVNVASKNIYFESGSATLDPYSNSKGRTSGYRKRSKPISTPAPPPPPSNTEPNNEQIKKRGNYNWSNVNTPVEINTPDLVIERPYLKMLDSVAKENKFIKYLELRKENSNPTFFLNVANMFFKDGDSATGYKILSNIAELNLADHESCKMLGYRLKSMQKFDDELMIFRKAMQLRPQDPQSYRDYALALADAGKFQQALDTLYLSMTKQYDRQLKNLYPGIEEIILTELNELIALHGSQLNISKIPKELIRQMPVALRTVLNWNINDTDIDLWLIDPNGEKCYYSHKQTDIGGRISMDFTRGYGPEQFMLKNAIKGKYQLIANYYGDTRQRIAGTTTLMAEIIINYGTTKEQKKVVALQMQGKVSNAIVLAEFSF